ncbi:MAG: SAM-dependent methyltransferase [Pseudomonadota bacterium]
MPDSTAAQIRDVSDTAIWVAQYRAEETARPDALFDDPLAKLLVGERGAQIAKSFGSSSRYTAWSVVSRTVIIDEYILQAISNGVDAVVNLGAGLDTRPYRLDLPSSFKWVETDFPHMMEYKQQKLREHTPRCRLERVGVDLSDAAARRSFLASVATDAHKVLVLTEGVAPYLTETQVAELAADLRAQPRFALWIVEYFAEFVYPYLRAVGTSARMKNAPFRFFPQDWDGFFLDNGWERREIRYSSEISRRFGRAPPMPLLARIFMKIARKKTMQRMASSTGYLLLGPRRLPDSIC